MQQESVRAQHDSKPLPPLPRPPSFFCPLSNCEITRDKLCNCISSNQIPVALLILLITTDTKHHPCARTPMCHVVRWSCRWCCCAITDPIVVLIIQTTIETSTSVARTNLWHRQTSRSDDNSFFAGSGASFWAVSSKTVSCPDLLAKSTALSSFLCARSYRRWCDFMGTFHCFWLTHTAAGATPVRKRRRRKTPNVTESLTRLVSQCRWQSARTRWASADGGEAANVLAQAYSAEERWRTNGGRWIGSLSCCCRGPWLLPTGGARTKGNVHGAQIQSLVMQKSWDRLSGWRTNGQPS